MGNTPFVCDYETEHYLSTGEAAQYLDISRQAFRLRTPPKPQVLVGDAPGWTKEVLDAWDAHFRANRLKPGRKPANAKK